MAINLRSPEVEIREKRLKSLLSYNGTASDLNEKSNTGVLKCREGSFNQCGDCSAQRAFNQVAQIRDVAVVSHGPIGCAGDFANFNSENRGRLESRGLKSSNIQALSTNLLEKDTVYGGIVKLKAAINEAYRRFNPKVIFVTTSCASGIIGDDVESAINEKEEELRIPVIGVYCEGFKSKIWTTGFDASFHAVLRKIVKPPKQKQEDLINVFNFAGTDVFTSLFAKIGLRPNYVIQLSTVEQLEKLSEAVASTHVCETLGTYPGKILEQEYGVPEVKAPTPFGLQWTDAWLREIGRITNREEAVEEVIISERERIRPQLEELRESLQGKRIYVLAGASYVHNMISITNDLGLEVIGATSFHHDQHFDNDDERLNSLNNVIEAHGDIKHYNVCNKQPHQIINILKDLKPDLLIVRHGNIAGIGTKLGIPTVMTGDANIGVGYDGVLETGERLLQAIQTKNLIRNISKHAKFPYTDWWYEQSPFYFQGGAINE